MRLADWPRDPYLNEEVREWVQLHLDALGATDVAVFAAVVGREEEERRVVVATEVGLVDSWYAPRGSSARYGLSIRLYPWQAVHGVDLRGETSRVWAYEHESRWRLRVARPALDLLAETPELGRALAQFAAACAVMAEPAGADDEGRPREAPAAHQLVAPVDHRQLPAPPPRSEMPVPERSPRPEESEAQTSVALPPAPREEPHVLQPMRPVASSQPMTPPQPLTRPQPTTPPQPVTREHGEEAEPLREPTPPEVAERQEVVEKQDPAPEPTPAAPDPSVSTLTEADQPQQQPAADDQPRPWQSPAASTPPVEAAPAASPAPPAPAERSPMRAPEPPRAQPAPAEPAMSLEEQYPGEEVLFGINPLPAELPAEPPATWPAQPRPSPDGDRDRDARASSNGTPVAGGMPQFEVEQRHGPFPRQVIGQGQVAADPDAEPRPARFPGQIFRVGGSPQPSEPPRQADAPERTPIKVEAESTAEVIMDLERRLGLRPRR